MMTEKLEVDSTQDTPRFYLDGDIYPFAWNRVTSSDPIDTSGLPSLDYTLHLFQIVQFHLGQAYRFFDHDSFIARIRQFYNSPSDGKAAEPRFWFVQFLMVLALGNAFLSRPRNQKDPPGAKFFVRAMSAMPNYTSTGKDSLLAIEALALVGLYLYAIDHREAAHVHVCIEFLPVLLGYLLTVINVNIGWSCDTNCAAGRDAYSTSRRSSWCCYSCPLSQSVVVFVHHGSSLFAITGTSNDNKRR